MMMEPIKNLSFFFRGYGPHCPALFTDHYNAKKNQPFLKFSFSSKLGVDEEFDVRDTMSEARVQHR